MYALFRLCILVYSQYKSRGYHIQQHNQCSFLPVFVVLTLKGVSPYDAFIPFVPSPWFQTDRASPFRPSGIPDDTLVGSVHHPRARRKMATDENGEAKAGKGLAGMAQAVVLQIIASVRALYVRSAPWLMLVRRSLRWVGRGWAWRDCARVPRCQHQLASVLVLRVFTRPRAWRARRRAEVLRLPMALLASPEEASLAFVAISKEGRGGARLL